MRKNEYRKIDIKLGRPPAPTEGLNKKNYWKTFRRGRKIKYHGEKKWNKIIFTHYLSSADTFLLRRCDPFSVTRPIHTTAKRTINFRRTREKAFPSLILRRLFFFRDEASPNLARFHGTKCDSHRCCEIFFLVHHVTSILDGIVKIK